LASACSSQSLNIKKLGQAQPFMMSCNAAWFAIADFVFFALTEQLQ
jgi:hypothetical protein